MIKTNMSRRRIYDLLNPGDHGDRLSDSVNIVIIALILLNVLSASLETVDGLYEAYLTVFASIELLSVIVFSVEYGLRLWSSLEDKKYQTRGHFVFSFDSVVDLLAIIPFYIGLFFAVDLRALIALRLLRLLKLIRYFEPLVILGKVMKAEFRAFMAAMFVLITLVFVAATGIYLFENSAQPEVFGSIPQSMWWAVVTLTTLGYGDVVPMTVAGQIFASAITILSIGTVALPAGMLASRFSEELRKRKNEMGQRISSLAADGNLSSQDQTQLEEYRTNLCLSEDDMQKLIEQQQNQHDRCPVCGRGETDGK